MQREKEVEVGNDVAPFLTRSITLSIFDAQLPKFRCKVGVRGITGCGKTSLISNICGKEIPLRHNHTFGLQVSVTNWYIQRDSRVEGIEFEFYDGQVEGFSITFDIILYVLSASDSNSQDVINPNSDEMNSKHVACIVLAKNDVLAKRAICLTHLIELGKKKIYARFSNFKYFTKRGFVEET